MISSIIRLLIPGQTPPVGEDSRERPRVCVCAPVWGNMDTPFYRHKKKKQCTHPPFLSQCYICAQSTFTEWFIELFGHVTDELLCNIAPCNKPAFLVWKMVRGDNILWQLVKNNCAGKSYITTSQTSQSQLIIFRYLFGFILLSIFWMNFTTDHVTSTFKNTLICLLSCHSHSCPINIKLQLAAG